MSNESNIATLRENRDLLRLACRFNRQPAKDLHPAHIPPVFSKSQWQALVRSKRGQRRLSNWIVEHWSLDERGIWDFTEPRRRLALLDRESIQRLVTLLGVAGYREDITRAIDRSRRNQLTETIGVKAYEFALKRSAFLIKNLPISLPGPLFPNVVEQVQKLGESCLSCCLADQPGELLERVSLKLSPEFNLAAGAEFDSQKRIRMWKITKRILLTEICPDLSKCFS